MKEATIHFYCLFDESRFSDICTIMELKELNWLCKHMKNVRSRQPCILMNFCKARVLRVRGCLHVKFQPRKKLVPGWNHPCLLLFTRFCRHETSSRDESLKGVYMYFWRMNSNMLSKVNVLDIMRVSIQWNITPLNKKWSPKRKRMRTASKKLKM